MKHPVLAYLAYPVVVFFAWLHPSDQEFQKFRASYRDVLKAPKGPERDRAREAYWRLRDRQSF